MAGEPRVSLAPSFVIAQHGLCAPPCQDAVIQGWVLPRTPVLLRKQGLLGDSGQLAPVVGSPDDRPMAFPSHNKPQITEGSCPACTRDPGKARHPRTFRKNLNFESPQKGRVGATIT